MGVVSCLYQAMSNALLLALYTMLGFFDIYSFCCYTMLALQVIKNNLFHSGVLLCAFCSFFEILSFPILKVKEYIKIEE